MSELQSQEQAIDVWANHREKMTADIIKVLRKRPYTIPELAQELDLTYQTVRKYLFKLADSNQIEIIEDGNTVWLGLRGHDYNIDLANADIKDIPECWFHRIPIIRDWHRYADTRGRKDDLKTFKNICYGRVVDKFLLNPAHWQHPETTRKFRDAYERQYNAPFKPHIRDAVRTFLQLCLGVKLTKYDAAIFGLKVTQPKEGKYRFLKMTPEEFDRACLWLDSEPCKQLCEQFKIRHTALLAHWSIAISSFGRPSAVLALETRAIRNDEGKVLQFMLKESKQGKTFPKCVKEPRLMQWVESYRQERLAQSDHRWKYLFLTDIGELAETRKKYNSIYKELFRILGKQEPVWYKDSLYCLRHIGIQRWIQLYGFAAVPLLQSAGFPQAKTLFDHYAGLTLDAFSRAVKMLNPEVSA